MTDDILDLVKEDSTGWEWHQRAGIVAACVWALVTIPLLVALGGYAPLRVFLMNYSYVSVDVYVSAVCWLGLAVYVYAVWQQRPKGFGFFNPVWWIATCFGLGYIARYFKAWWTKIVLMLPAVLTVGWYVDVLPGQVAIALFAGAVCLKGAGTLGTIFGCVLLVMLAFLPREFGFDPNYIVYGLLPITLAITVVGTWASQIYVDKTGREDPSEVIIDEVAGMFVATIVAVVAYALMLGLYKADFLGYLQYFSVVYVLVLFVLFRVFDIWKPYPINLFEKLKPEGWGIMADDLMAGVYAGLCFLLFLLVMHAFGGFDLILEYQ